MTIVQVKSEVNIEIDELIGGVSQLATRDIEQLLSALSIMLAQRKVSSLPARESVLLQKIAESVADTVQDRYDMLQAKLLTEQITLDEHAELLDLIDIVEQADADRLQALIELAQLREITLDEVMAQLGIHPPPAYV